MKTLRYAAAPVCLFLGLAHLPAARADDRPAPADNDRQRCERFEMQVEQLRTLLKIPGMSAVVLRDQRVLWSKGFGFADIDKKIPATPETLYHVASLTKTLAATLLLRLAEQGKLDLDEPVSRYSAAFKDDAVRVKHLLSHTSEGTPGESYRYHGDRFHYLTAVLEKKTGKTFRQLVVETFLDPLGMDASVPGHDALDQAGATLDQPHRERYRRNLEKFALPYTLYGTEVVRESYPPRHMGAAAGLLSTVLDMARFDAAIDRHQFLKPETQDRAWTRFVSTRGKALPHGLGWFVQDYHGVKLVWHFGHWGTGFSATYLKVPAKGLTLIMLGNSEALSDPFYATGGMETNAFACAFLRVFVLEGLRGRTLPDPDWSRGPREFADEVKRLSEQAGGSGYENTRETHALVMKWLDNRRAKARVAIKVDPKTYDAYVGRFELPSKQIISATRDGERFFTKFPTGAIVELFPEAEGKFFTKIWDIRVTFGKDADGKVTHLDIVERDLPSRRAKKVP
jgi:CubicO group peptidase (beta-lactamase class C family)